MTQNKASLVEDLAPFADLGTSAPQVVHDGANLVCRLIREGRQMELTVDEKGAIRLRSEGVETFHATFKALLASGSFANLRRWAESQRILLRGRVEEENIQLIGVLSENPAPGGVELLDDALFGVNNQTSNRVLVVLIDGPAGIGKTSLIRLLCYRRASRYLHTQRPLLLHVESRGRVLQNITDLMAFWLQTLRLNVTYDQIPILVRHGLIALAVDGFDELGDPNGYELAWAQVNDLIVASRGSGVLVLSGRDTFVTRSRMEFALSAIDPKLDQIRTFTLESIRPSVARSWLTSKGWRADQLENEAAQPLFEEGSYALKPFFLKELSRTGVAEQICHGEIEDLLTFLIDAMTSRESGKFGLDIDNATTKEVREGFVVSLMEEVARDLAENQTDALPDESIAWLAEVVAQGLVPPELTGILRNRASVVAFLTEDERRGYKRFLHEQVQNYFLSKVTVSAIVAGELPKYIRRNILGPEFLQNFCDVLRHNPQDLIDAFMTSMQHQLASLGSLDRSKRNLGALIFATCSVASPSGVPGLSNLSLDEIYCTETLSRIRLSKCTIAQLNARGADLRKVEFGQECFIISMNVDNGTLIPESMPTPNLINTPLETLASPEEKFNWIYWQYGPAEPASDEGRQIWMPDDPLFDLLARVARYKPFWLKEGDEKAAKRILEDPNWDTLKEILAKHDFLVERKNVPASGRPGSFFHIKKRQNLLDINELPEAVFDDLIGAVGDGGDILF